MDEKIFQRQVTKVGLSASLMVSLLVRDLGISTDRGFAGRCGNGTNVGQIERVYHR